VITTIQVKAFRGVREGQVEGLSPVSILVGPNNSGKSTCLDALACVGFGSSASSIVRLLLRRGGPPLDALQQIHKGIGDRTELVALGEQNGQAATWSTELKVGGPRRVEQVNQAKSEGLEERMLRFSVAWDHRPEQESGASSTYVDQRGKTATNVRHSGPFFTPFPCRLVDVETVRGRGALENAYSELERSGQARRVVEALRTSQPGLTDLRILKIGEEFVLHSLLTSPPPIPAYVAGDGFKRFLELAAAMLPLEPGVVLLEEPESYQHPRYLRELATLMLSAARAGTQVILSTHSLELIDTLLGAPEAEGLAYPSVHRLRLADGELTGVTLDRERALALRHELLEDLRA
jgi:energy-coupling factor transporter ATP-binding protein EcfA2